MHMTIHTECEFSFIFHLKKIKLYLIPCPYPCRSMGNPVEGVVFLYTLSSVKAVGLMEKTFGETSSFFHHTCITEVLLI